MSEEIKVNEKRELPKSDNENFPIYEVVEGDGKEELEKKSKIDIEDSKSDSKLE